MKMNKKITLKQKIAGVLFLTMVLATPAISFASQALSTNAYVIGSYLTSGDTSKALGIIGTVYGAAGGIGSALGLLCGVQTAVLIGIGA
jgi:hypothetical protein